MCNFERFFLDVVGGQPVIFVAHVGLEEAPGAARHDATGAHVFGENFRRFLDHAAADEIRD